MENLDKICETLIKQAAKYLGEPEPDIEALVQCRRMEKWSQEEDEIVNGLGEEFDYLDIPESLIFEEYEEKDEKTGRRACT